MSDDYYTIRSRGLSDMPVPSRPSPLRAALLFSSAVIALTVLVVPELDSRRLGPIAAMLPGATPDLDYTAVGSIDPYGVPSNALPSGLRGGRGDMLPGATRQGSVEMRRRAAPGRSYVVRRSVLNEGSVCIIGPEGSRTGAC